MILRFVTSDVIAANFPVFDECGEPCRYCRGGDAVAYDDRCGFDTDFIEQRGIDERFQCLCSTLYHKRCDFVNAVEIRQVFFKRL